MIKIPYSRVSIIQIGCGGTGGYLVPKIARLLMTLKQFKGDCRYKYILVDHDTVEPANLYRQNFIEEDLGRNKASVLSIRYGFGFHVDIGCVKDILSTPEQLKTYLEEYADLHILIGCVDNNTARKVMHDHFQASRVPIVYIDSGNGKLTGQVVVGYKNKKVILPPVGDIFPEALVEVEKPQITCAMNALENPQNIGANDFAASLIFSVINILLTNEEINTHWIAFDGRTGEAIPHKA